MRSRSVLLAVLIAAVPLPAFAIENPFAVIGQGIEQSLNQLQRRLDANQPRRGKPKVRKVAPAAAKAGEPAVQEKAAVPEPPAKPAEVATAADADGPVPSPRPRPGDPAIGGYVGEATKGEKAVGGFVEPAEPAADAAEVPLPLPRIRPHVASAAVLPDAEPATPPSKPPLRLAELPPPSGDAGTGIAALNALGVTAKAMPAIADHGCGMPDPVVIASLDHGDVPLSGTTPLVNREVTATLAGWVKDDVQPAARQILGGPLTGLRIADAYTCRTRDHIEGAKMSEHAYGNAIDISAFRIGKTWIEVAGDHPADQQAFLDKIRAAACGPFKTVLGPGSDSYHSSHFHLDLAQRRTSGPSRGLFCQ